MSEGFRLPVVFVLLGFVFSSGERVFRRQELNVGEIIGNGGVQVDFDSSVLGIFCNDPPLRLVDDEGGDERLLIRDVCNVSHGRS